MGINQKLNYGHAYQVYNHLFSGKKNVNELSLCVINNNQNFY